MCVCVVVRPNDWVVFGWLVRCAKCALLFACARFVEHLRKMIVLETESRSSLQTIVGKTSIAPLPSSASVSVVCSVWTHIVCVCCVCVCVCVCVLCVCV
jgi:hypothetical protein